MSRSSRSSEREDWVSALPFDTIVFHRTVALYRNLEETVFPERATPPGLENARARVFDALAAAGAAEHKPVRFFSNPAPAILEPGAGNPPAGYFSGLPVPHDLEKARWTEASFADLGRNAVTAVVNAEDHLALFDRSNGPFVNQWRTLDSLASRMENTTKFARSTEYGYLAANPDRVGTGLELFCDISIFGLCVSRQSEQVLNALERLGFDAEPVFNPPEDDEEASFDAPGCRYWIHSARDAGTEDDIVGRMDTVCRELARQEQNARLRMLQSRSPALEDFIVRSLAAASFACLMSWAEAVDIAQALLMAHDLGMLRIEPKLRAWLDKVPATLSDAVLGEKVPENTDLKVARAKAMNPMCMPLITQLFS